jgi:ADP-ribose pyrophosphatase YjhB (NUDIX family)
MVALNGWQHCPRCASTLTSGHGYVTCSSCGSTYYASSAPAASALVLDDQGRVLLVRRAREPDAGKWDAPGGFIEEGEDPLDALRRELREETGLEVEPTAFVTAYTDRYGSAAEDRATLNLLWEARVVGGAPQPDDDVSELRWFDLDELPPDGEIAFTTLRGVIRAWVARRNAEEPAVPAPLTGREEEEVRP